MKLNEKVSNPMLVGAIQLMKADDTDEHRSMFLQELLKATLLIPVKFEPGAAGDEGNTGTGGQICFPALNGKNGLKFLIVYTDKAAMNTRNAEGKETTPAEFRENTAALSLEELASLILVRSKEGVPSPYVGFVLNPGGENVIVGREQVAYLMERRVQIEAEAAARRRAGDLPDIASI